jgi:hypothetical protein
MVQTAVGTAIVALCYICLTIILFAPTIYVVWLSMVSRKVPGKRKGLTRTTVSTFLINAAVVVLLSYVAFTYLVTSAVAKKDAVARDALRSAVAAERQFFASHGRYYAVGPVRGPYEDESGLIVKEDTILQVVPYWDEASRREAFRAYALHVWGNDLLAGSEDGRIASAPHDSEKAAKIRARLVNSVK